MLTEILKRTPPWVFVLFFVLLALGYSQSKDRIVAKSKTTLLPIVMLALSFYGVISAFGIATMALASWLAGGLVAVFAGPLLVAPRGVFYAKDTRSFHIPGSWLPLVIMMAIFVTKYAVGVVIARHIPCSPHAGHPQTVAADGRPGICRAARPGRRRTSVPGGIRRPAGSFRCP